MQSKKKARETLRKKAEKLIPGELRLPSKWHEDTKKLIHELQVHQIELEMQNDQLRKAQEELEESRAKYSDLYDLAPVAYFTFTSKGVITEANLTGAALLGTERTLLIGRHFTNKVSPADRPRFRRHLYQISQSGEKGRVELELIRKDGTSFCASFESILADSDGKIRSAVSDISDLKNAEANAEEERSFRLAVDRSILSGIVAIDREGRESYVNPAFCRMVGWSEEELLGIKPPFPYWPPEETKAILQVFHQALKNEAAEADRELRFMRIDGTRFDVRVLISPLVNGSGESMGSIISVHDITERKKGQAALRESERKLRNLSTKLLNAQEEERRRVAMELHDGLGQSLAAIKFKVESIVAMARAGGLDKAIESLESVVPLIQAGVRETHRMYSDLRPSVLDDLGIGAALSWFFRRFEETYSDILVVQNIKIQEDVPAPMKIAIYRIAQEAMNNIAKHSSAKVVNVSLHRNSTRIELAIQDNGEGFDLTEKLNITDFGKGLGLASMKERAELSGGTFWMESRKGEGTEIHASWSLSDDETSGSERNGKGTN